MANVYDAFTSPQGNDFHISPGIDQVGRDGYSSRKMVRWDTPSNQAQFRTSDKFISDILVIPKGSIITEGFLQTNMGASGVDTSLAFAFLTRDMKDRVQPTGVITLSNTNVKSLRLSTGDPIWKRVKILGNPLSEDLRIVAEIRAQGSSRLSAAQGQEKFVRLTVDFTNI